MDELDKCTEFPQILANNLFQVEKVQIEVWIFGNIRISIEVKMFEAICNFVRRTPSDALQRMTMEIDSHRVGPNEQYHIHVTRNRIGNWDSIVERKFTCVHFVQ